MSDEPHEPHDRETDGAARRPRRRRWGMRLLLTFLLFAVAMQWGSTRRAERALRAEMDAVRAAGEPATVEEWNHWPGARSGTGENAMPLLRAAADPIDPASQAWHAAMDAIHTPPPSEPDFAAMDGLLKAYPNALSSIDAACARGAIDWGMKLESPLMARMPKPGEIEKSEGVLLGTLGGFLNVAARAAHHRGDDAEAVKRLGQMLFIGRAMQHGPSYVNHLHATGQEALTCRAVSDLAPGLRVGGVGGASKDQVLFLIGRLLDETDLAEGFRRAWVGQRVLLLDLPNAAFNGGSQTVNFAGVNMRIPGMRFAFRPMVLDNTRAMSRYTTAVIETVAKSPDLPTFRANFGDPVPEVAKSPTRYMHATIIMPSLSHGPEVHYRALAERRLAAVCLAVRVYAVDHGGTLPDRLEDLVRDYLPSVPLDPLATGQPLRYVNPKSDPLHPRVYSVGPNGVDDGGNEAESKPRRGDAAPSTKSASSDPSSDEWTVCKWPLGP